MKLTAESNIAELIACLAQSGLTLRSDERTGALTGLTGREIAEALYLAAHLPPFQTVEVAPTDEKPITTTPPIETPEPLEPPREPAAHQPPTEPAPDTPAGNLYTRAENKSTEPSVAAQTFRAAAAIALPGAADIARALRPLLRRYPSRTRRQLDIERTVQRTADSGGAFIAVEQPARERWLDLALVLDHSASMHVWRPTVRELQRLLERYGAFRHVTVWGIRTDEGTAKFFRESGGGHPDELFDPHGRRLILLVSDCIGAGWQQGAAFQLLARWAARAPVVLAQVLPQHLWTATALPAPDVLLRAPNAAAPNRKLRGHTSGTPLPVVTLEDWSIAPWANMLAARGHAEAPGIVITDVLTAPAPVYAEPAPVIAEPEDERAQRIVNRFRGSATPTALRLACYLAAVELNLPVMRLVQQAMLPHARQIHLAEVFLGGLLQPVSDSDDNPDETRYDFHPGVRERLLELTPRSETHRVVTEVWRLIENRLPFADDFQVLLANPALEDSAYEVAIGRRAFATISPTALRKIGVRPMTPSVETVRTDAPPAEELLLANYEGLTPVAQLETAKRLLDYANSAAGAAARLSDEALLSAYQTVERATLKQMLLIVQWQKRLNGLDADDPHWTEMNQHLVRLTEMRQQFGYALHLLLGQLHERESEDTATVETLLIQTVMTDLERLGQWRDTALKLTGLWLTEQHGEQVAALTQLGELFAAFGDHHSALRYFVFAQDLMGGEVVFMPEREFPIAFGAAKAHAALGDDEAAEQALALAQDIARRAQNQTMRLQTLMARGALRMTRGLLADSYDEYLVASELAQQNDDQRSFAICLLQLGILSLKQADPNRAIASLQEAAALFGRLASVKSEAQALAHLCRAYLALHDAQQAITWGDRAIHLFLSYQDQESVAALESELATARQTVASSLAPSYFSFDTVTLDERGEVVERRTLRARQFVETLAPGVTLEMVEIPGGTFAMGSDEQKYEQPIHRVNVAPFFMGKFAVTQAQWRVVAGWPQVARKLSPEPSYFRNNKRRTAADDQRPVEQVSWEEAQEFCARLSAKTGRSYCLPSEAQWEYACRAGTTTPFAFGPTITPEFVNYDGNYPYGKAPKGTCRRETVPVGSLGVANAFGLYDMHGNVWEWCEDVWHESYEKAPDDGSSWLSDGNSSRRVLRGGSWYNFSRNCRSANRFNYTPSNRDNSYGFRVVVGSRTS